MKKPITLLMLCMLSLTITAQTFISQPTDSETLIEYYDGHEWAYQRKGNIVIGLTNYKDKNDYGTYYQIGILVQNLDDKSILFDPEGVTANLKLKDGKEKEMQVYAYEDYMKMIKKKQMWGLSLFGFAAGLEAGSAGYGTTTTTGYVGGMPYTQYSTTYNSGAASAANIAAQTQVMTLGSLLENDKKVVSQGYLKKTTVHSGESIIGIMNIKHKKGEAMTVNVDIEGTIFTFDWDIAKKKK